VKKALIVIAIGLAVVAALAWVFRDAIQFLAMRTMLKPSASFAETTPPPAPDYADAAWWAALPDRKDNADVTPNGVADEQANAAADVFFIHPTTHYSAASWNQALDDTAANTITDDGVLRGQASAFNGCCRIYAPRYRQATLYSFFEMEGDGEDAIDLAYGDVEQAFDYWLEHYNAGRPFVVAAHSQGSLHLDRLLRERIHGTPLAARMIAAYPVGYFLDGTNGVPVCAAATETGCQVTWNSLAPDAPSFRDSAEDLCVNPLTWRTDGARADFAANLGSVTWGFGGQELAEPGRLETGVADAQCDGGRLVVTEVRSERYPALMFGEGNYHVYDYGLYYMNVRANAQARVRAFLANAGR
jgi:hypothetical protein